MCPEEEPRAQETVPTTHRVTWGVTAALFAGSPLPSLELTNSAVAVEEEIPCS